MSSSHLSQPYFVVANDKSTHTVRNTNTGNPESEHFPNVKYIFADDEPIDDAGPAVYVDFDESGTKVTKFHSEIPDWQVTDVIVDSFSDVIDDKNSELSKAMRLKIQGIQSKPVYLDLDGGRSAADLETTDLRTLKEFFKSRNDLLHQIVSKVPITEGDFDVEETQVQEGLN
ncbi:hypothetical protein CJU90_5167 [Yarrowia sp. C11]|nr:hypothetical protein CJU90_5167 [Yarrowia sp. C11]